MSYARAVRGVLILLVAVLAAIGIGVAGEAASGPAVFVPPGARFTAAWPGAVAQTPIAFHGLGGTGELYRSRLGDEQLTVRVTILPRRAGTLAFSPNASGVPAVRLIESLHPARPFFFRRLRVAGRFATIGISCARVPALGGPACSGILLDGEIGASKGDVVGLAATATGSSDADVRARLTSIRLLVGPGARSTAAPKVTGVAALQRPGALAISPTGTLYVADDATNRVLRLEPDGRFVVVAGTGRLGHVETGPAAASRLQRLGQLAFAPNGTLYLSDGRYVQAVSSSGTLTTVAGDGRPAQLADQISNGAPARRAGLPQVTGLTVGPAGMLYLSTGTQILRLHDGRLFVVADRRRFAGLPRSTLRGEGLILGNLAFDARGDLYVSVSGVGFALYELSTSGRARYVGPLRRGGGNTSSLAAAPGGTVVADWQNSIVRIAGARIEGLVSFSRGTAPGVKETFLPNDLAVAPNGAIVADADGENGWSTTSAIVELEPHRHVVTLWHEDLGGHAVTTVLLPPSSGWRQPKARPALTLSWTRPSN